MSAPKDLPPMEYRFLGRSGLKVSAIGLGGWLTYGGHVENENTFACMKAAYDAGVNFFDCAEAYSGGESEKMMGEAIKKFGWNRNDIVVTTKINWGAAYGKNPANNVGLSRKHIIEGLNGALDRLQLEYVDVVYAHRPDRQTPMEEIVRAFNHVINQGKAMYWGTSEWDADEIATAWKYAEKLNMIGPIVEQPQYNMLTRLKVEREFAHLYAEYGLGLTTFSPLKMGILTGKYNDGIPADSRLGTSSDKFTQGYKETYVGSAGWKSDIDKVAKLAPIATRLHTTQAVLALAWVLRNQHVSSMITGASRPQQVFDNIQALTVQHQLTDELMAEMDEILDNKPPAVVLRYS